MRIKCHWKGLQNSWMKRLRLLGKEDGRVPTVAQQLKKWLVSTRTQVWSLALLSGLRICSCRELWCRLQTWLGSCDAVAVATVPIWPLAWEPPYVSSTAWKQQKKKRKEKKKKMETGRNQVIYLQNMACVFMPPVNPRGRPIPSLRSTP